MNKTENYKDENHDKEQKEVVKTDKEVVKTDDEVVTQPQLSVKSIKEQVKADDLTTIQHQLSAKSINDQAILIQEVMKMAMKEGSHYDVIPGCGSKPTLLKPGAEKLALTFRLSPSYVINKTNHENGHREYEVTTTIKHIASGKVYGEGVGSCSTLESKYRYRYASLLCPCCENETIIKGKKEYGGGWVCYIKKGGCGAKFDEDDKAITSQKVGKVEHSNPADYYNTILKIAKKRSLVDAILTVTAASDMFTQDLDDLVANGVIKPIAGEINHGNGNSNIVREIAEKAKKIVKIKNGTKLIRELESEILAIQKYIADDDKKQLRDIYIELGQINEKQKN